MASDRRVADTDPNEEPPTREERIDAARSVVYDSDGDLIGEDGLEAALEAHGVDVGVNEDGLPDYRNVPRELSLSAVHLAIETRDDPAEFIVDPAEV